MIRSIYLKHKDQLALALDILVVTAFVFSVTCWVYRHELASGRPIVYSNDGLCVLARIKAYAQGETSLFTPQLVSRLNAPFSASWSDYPSDKLSFYQAGLLARFFGMGYGSTIAVLLLHTFSGLCFLGAARMMNFNRLPSVACAVLFGLAPYAFHRNLNHLNLLFYGLLPLLVVMIVRLMRHHQEIRSRSGILILILVSFVAGLFNPYYFLWYLGFLLLLMISNMAQKKWRFAMIGLIAMVAGMSGFIIQNLDTFLLRHQFGVNQVAVCRSYQDLAKYGLTLPDLFFPNTHVWSCLQSLSRNLYITKVPDFLAGESQTAYIGLVAAAAFVWMMMEGVFRILGGRPEKVHSFFWLAWGVLALGLVGGVNYFLGAFGFYLLRGTNRFSILLAGLALLFLCDKLSSRTLGFWRLPIVALVVLLGVWDQIPALSQGEANAKHYDDATYLQDSRLFPRMEGELPAGAMVFQLPVHFFPEQGGVCEMGDYEHLRPYIHTSHLRFSYGTIKGRDDTWWQFEIERKPPIEMVKALEGLGFSALLINRKAYTNHGSDFIKQMEVAGFMPWINEGDFVAYRLSPDPHTTLPNILDFQVKYSGDFYPEETVEGNRMLRCGKLGEIIIKPAFRITQEKVLLTPKSAHFSFSIATANPKVWVFAGINGAEEQVVAAPGEAGKTIVMDVPPAGAKITFRAMGALNSRSGDSRDDIRFQVVNPCIFN